ncbi:CpsD/CapB family tyrosine-protein kinase [Paenibacillus sp. J5C_2022]|uniref:CpsD/CapB family tyrosine-protein kinase n=1 Tax=Paenibacillus sp. J5C2022 TaxID=2977129 RepID=UPI0021D097A7|nr:CpsD/CapB family tyrosine-protein kinase [Paenibacillus sp. J5C2022]MCU6710308.1 CpsD/CapB family tyrosine-protein kinase [Paenibacillus sp. J5C2022]
MVRERAKVARSVIHRSLYSYLQPSGRIAEQFRTIRNNIQYSVQNKTIKSVMITSPGEGDGKTTAAVNLAISMANRGEKVLLVDANFRNPMIHKLFQLQASPGLSNVLSKQLNLNEAVQHTEIPSLHLLTSGQRQANSTELLDSDVMKGLIIAAAEKYDRIVLDCPPVLSGPDTNMLVKQCDGVVLLLQCGKSTHGMALEAKQSLAFAGANIVGAILNKKER